MKRVIEGIDPRTDYRLVDPTQALHYDAPDPHLAARIEQEFESQLDHEIREYRAMGHHGGVQHMTRFKMTLSRSLGQLLDDLEILSSCRRRSGYFSSSSVFCVLLRPGS